MTPTIGIYIAMFAVPAAIAGYIVMAESFKVRPRRRRRFYHAWFARFRT